MPNQRTHYGGPTLISGIFRGDDEVATGLPTQHAATSVHVDGGDVVIDAHNLEGTIFIKHDFGAQGQDVLLAEDKTTGDRTFQVTKTGDLWVRDTVFSERVDAQTLSHVDSVDGSAFSHEDDATVAALATVVQRDPGQGAVTIANLRCKSRKLNLDGNGNAPDGFPPGLF